jgi:type II secretory pathway pseudopilin PulG
MTQTRCRRRDGGFTLIEVVIALCVIVLTLIGLIAGISYASRTNATIQEDELAMRGAQKIIETIRSYPVGMVWACFNNAPNDAVNLHPTLAWNATSYPEMASNQFVVDGLTPIGDTINGVTWTQCGLVSFPGDQTTTLVEITDPADPMYDENATDLNANHVTNETLTVGEKYNLLPVTITLRWRGITGKRTMTFRYLLINTPTGSPADFTYPGQN